MDNGGRSEKMRRAPPHTRCGTGRGTVVTTTATDGQRKYRDSTCAARAVGEAGPAAHPPSTSGTPRRPSPSQRCWG
eukprot:2594058-Prymnesium_polylepis.1